MTTTKFKNTDEYIASFPPDVQDVLEQVRQTIKKAAPDAEEGISYNMPAFKFHGVLTYFAGYAKHIGVYATPAGNAAFQKELSGYKTGKGSIQFPLDQPMPLDLITRIIEFKVSENLQKANIKKNDSKNKPAKS